MDPATVLLQLFLVSVVIGVAGAMIIEAIQGQLPTLGRRPRAVTGVPTRLPHSEPAYLRRGREGMLAELSKEWSQ